MKKLIYSLSFLLVLGSLLGTANAQSKRIPGSPINVPQVLDRVIVNPSQDKGAPGGVQVTPNPCNGHCMLRFNSPNGGKTGITVSDTKGNGMFVIEMIANPGINSVPLNFSAYGSGIYSVTVSGGGAYGTTQVTVTKPSH